MCFVNAAKGCTCSVSEFLSGQDALRLRDAACAVDSVGFDGIEPGTCARQSADQDAYTGPVASALAAIFPSPAVPGTSDMPPGVVPYQDQGTFQPDAFGEAGHRLCG